MDKWTNSNHACITLLVLLLITFQNIQRCQTFLASQKLEEKLLQLEGITGEDYLSFFLMLMDLCTSVS